LCRRFADPNRDSHCDCNCDCNGYCYRDTEIYSFAAATSVPTASAVTFCV
jgi:hypothetical protein